MFRTILVSTVLSLAGVSASAESYSEITAELTFSRDQLATENGAESVLRSLERQAASHCRHASMIVVGLETDRVCVKDMVHQAVNQIEDDTLARNYADSSLYIETVSDRFDLAAR